MRRLLQVISWLSLAGTQLPSVLYLAGRMSLDQSIFWFNVATIVWFAATPLWMGRAKS